MAKHAAASRQPAPQGASRDKTWLIEAMGREGCPVNQHTSPALVDLKGERFRDSCGGANFAPCCITPDDSPRHARRVTPGEQGAAQ
ncbi:hypothetical protein CIC12_02945 [Burkholderia sp. SG-MS1]|nr:hypothetical protein [Paraburkholderia sp. SG-MS1]